MKGYYANAIYYGYLPSADKYFPFASEGEYKEYYKEFEEQKGE